MGNVNCTPSDCINMRPGQASECFKTPSDTHNRKVNNGTPQELFEEWTRVVQEVTEAFTDNPEGNLYVLKLSKPLLAHLFDKNTKLKLRQSSFAQEKTQSSQSNYGGSVRGKILSNIMMSPAVSSIRQRVTAPQLTNPYKE